MEKSFNEIGTYNQWKEVSLLLRRIEYATKSKESERDYFWLENMENDCLTLEELTGEQKPFILHKITKMKQKIQIPN